MKIQMVDLQSQYQKLKVEIDEVVSEVFTKGQFIGGPLVKEFESNLADFLDAPYVISVANGTDALQIALMAIDAKPGDEVIVPAFTYVATAEVIALLGLIPVLVDVDVSTFGIDIEQTKNAITEKTKAIVPVHLFGQVSNMEALMELANSNNLYVIEDNAQSLGAIYTFEDGTTKQGGLIGHIGTTSFYPSKVLGAYGDGGALFSNDKQLADKIRMIKSHGQIKKYYHEVVGCNSRLDAVQAGILNVKLNYLKEDFALRGKVADRYDEAFNNINQIQTPIRDPKSTHVFHQYTLIIADNKRDELKQYLADNDIPSMIYYPLPLYKQNAFKPFVGQNLRLNNSEQLCASVISLPICPNLTIEAQNHIISKVKSFF